MPSYRYLLDLDTDLADELDHSIRIAARQAATAVVFDVPPGEVGLADWLAVAPPGPGVLILEGLLVGEVCVAGRTAAELVGSGDLLQPLHHPEDEMIGVKVSWRAPAACRFALLDGGFAERVKCWPQIHRAMLRRAGRRTRALNVQRAISAQPRLEVRLALLLWHLGSRWGRVEPGGIRLTLPLTHQLLGHLVGAERPSVSHALHRLSDAGLVTGQSCDWHLRGTPEQQLSTMIEPERADVRRLVAELSAPFASQRGFG